MLEQPIYALTEPARIRELVAGHGWATLVSATDTGGPVVSHLPVIPDPEGDAEDLAIVGHLAKADAELHELGAHDAVVIVQGPGGYISPGHYRAGPYVPTWNFVVAHLHGRPTVLDGAETYRVLQHTVEHFEAARPEPWRLETVEDYAREIAPYTTGFRLRPTRVVGKHKLSQDKPQEVALRVADALAGGGPQGDAELAAAMRRVLVPGD
ncbi:FMN-binding negative transcriptional regulator [Streptomyces cocklensis]|uniref:Negative transcriptional regulator, PaiB family n=1 Tax=Actinacidiphila cocklensis TaxID=887465 RepID=A0A9W4GNB8_9ACTN|nr:FMN-binding negative transcriptional regulator [Actinacidiphila cocklensis]MDD1062004.1 FMN-binding negative transcriptional regulator [Actinacidiphila cocklensis]CAG6391200.1 Negative transcriptional regulator, PaiB family [Actinacidiphila cocklensis]